MINNKCDYDGQRFKDCIQFAYNIHTHTYTYIYIYIYIYIPIYIDISILWFSEICNIGS